jgi:hypothetical protein
MKRLQWLLTVVLILSGIQANAQQRTWGNFQINVPETWSMTQIAGSVNLSNYNIKNSEPFSITLFDASTIEGKTDSTFALVWKTYVAPLTGVTEVPRPRRLFTDEGIPIFQGFKEIPDKTNPQYYQLNVYVVNDVFQACLLRTTSLKNYRLFQAEWQERLLGIKMVDAKKKK